MTKTKSALSDDQYVALVNVVRHGYPKTSGPAYRALKRRGMVEHDLRHGTFKVTETGIAAMMERDGRTSDEASR